MSRKKFKIINKCTSRSKKSGYKTIRSRQKIDEVVKLIGVLGKQLVCGSIKEKDMIEEKYPED